MTTTAHAAGRPWRVFYSYTAWSVVVLLLLYPIAVAGLLDLDLTAALAEHPAAVVLLAVQILLGAWSARRAMERWSRAPARTGRDRWDLPRVGRLGSDWTLEVTAALLVMMVVLVITTGTDPRMLSIALAPVIGNVGLRWPWQVGLVAALVASALASVLGLARWEAVVVAAITASGVLAFRSSLWLAALVRELEDARQSQARLAVAEERLRFARDLHDVTGRDLSVIAVKAELVAQLAERGDDRATAHGQEVAQIARASLAEIRALVRGYREADLATELQGTASLLRSTHAEVQVVGSAQDVPAEFADTAAWVLREGGTNILRHADPAQVVITLGVEGMSLVNDGVPETGEPREGSGLTGLRERLGPDCPLTVRHEDGTFTLDVRFDTSGEHR